MFDYVYRYCSWLCLELESFAALLCMRVGSFVAPGFLESCILSDSQSFYKTSASFRSAGYIILPCCAPDAEIGRLMSRIFCLSTATYDFVIKCVCMFLDLLVNKEKSGSVMCERVH